jgi:hypothetical protein
LIEFEREATKHELSNPQHKLVPKRESEAVMCSSDDEIHMCEDKPLLNHKEQFEYEDPHPHPHKQKHKKHQRHKHYQKTRSPSNSIDRLNTLIQDNPPILGIFFFRGSGSSLPSST